MWDEPHEYDENDGNELVDEREECDGPSDFPAVSTWTIRIVATSLERVLGGVGDSRPHMVGDRHDRELDPARLAMADKRARQRVVVEDGRRPARGSRCRDLAHERQPHDELRGYLPSTSDDSGSSRG